MPDIPTEFALAGNYPNPFNPSTEIQFDLPTNELVRLVVYDVMCREVARLVDGELAAGTHRVRWEAVGLASGIYVYRLTTGTYSAVRSTMLVK